MELLAGENDRKAIRRLDYYWYRYHRNKPGSTEEKLPCLTELTN